MGKIIVSMNITLDGFMAGPDGELDWHFPYWDEEMSQELCRQLAHADTILLGRNTYTALSGYWPLKTTDDSLSRGDLVLAGMMNRYKKAVFSKTLSFGTWENSIIIRDNLVPGITKLTKLGKNNIIIYGSGQLVTSLIQHDLIDGYHLWLHPLCIQQGKRLFQSTASAAGMKLLSSKSFKSGVIVLCYAAGRPLSLA